LQIRLLVICETLCCIFLELRGKWISEAQQKKRKNEEKGVQLPQVLLPRPKGQRIISG